MILSLPFFSPVSSVGVRVEEAEGVISNVELLEEVVDVTIGKTVYIREVEDNINDCTTFLYTSLSHSPKAIVSTLSDTPNMLLVLKLITYIPEGSSIQMLYFVRIRIVTDTTFVKV